MSEAIKITKSQTVVFDVDGEIIKVQKPGVGRIRDLQASIEVAQSQDDGKAINGLMLSFLEEVGFPKHIVDACDTDAIEGIVTTIMTAKKKGSPHGT